MEGNTDVNWFNSHVGCAVISQAEALCMLLEIPLFKMAEAYSVRITRDGILTLLL